MNNFQYIFDSAGIESKIIHEVPEHQNVTDLWFCIWTGLSSLPKNCVVYNMDPMVEGVYESFIKLVKNSPPIKLFIDYCNGGNHDKIAHLKIPYTIIPYGFSEFHETLYDICLTPKVKISKDIDVLFYGNISERRKRMLTNIQHYCCTQGYNLVIRNNDLYDEKEKAKLIARSKIVLSISGNDALEYKTNDLARLSYLICNKACIVTERIGDTFTEDQLDLLFCNNVEEINHTITKYLTDDFLRLKNTEKVYKTFKELFPLQKQLISAVLPKINYIIASYSGRHSSRLEDPMSGKLLTKQISVLYDIIKNKTIEGIPNLIAGITVVCPECKPAHFPPYENYYEKEMWTEMFSRINVPIDYIDYHGNNTSHSYDQWIQGMLHRPDVDYHLLIEDDYLIDPEELQFDYSLISIYQRKFPNNIGYLATLCGPHNSFPYSTHSMISNGLISTDTVKSIPNILEEFYKIDIYPQLAFSKLFLDRKIDILDYSDTYFSLSSIQ
jgi:hypothetical protein